MTRPKVLGAWDLRTVRMILILAHASFAVLCLILRPYLFEIVHGYSGMLAVMPTRSWGAVAAVIAIGLAATGERPGVQIVVQLGSGMLLAMISVAVTTTVGPNLATVAYLVFGSMSLWAFHRVFSIWLYSLGWFQRAQNWIQERRRG